MEFVADTRRDVQERKFAAATAFTDPREHLDVPAGLSVHGIRLDRFLPIARAQHSRGDLPGR
ncbi:hypothetical protein GCM10027360_25690 [Amycolatopsis echigonensis]